MTPEALFYSFPEPVPDLCWSLRDLVLEAAPDAVERVRPGWRLLGFDLRQYFCGIAPQADHVRLLFERGAELDDPEARLAGAGTQVRYLRFDREEDVDPELVQHFVRLAIALQA